MESGSYAASLQLPGLFLKNYITLPGLLIQFSILKLVFKYIVTLSGLVYDGMSFDVDVDESFGFVKNDGNQLLIELSKI